MDFLNAQRFDVDVPGSAVYKESSFTEAGIICVLVSLHYSLDGYTNLISVVLARPA